MPITPSIPGIFPAERSRDSRTVTALPTGITAFVGAAERGPLDEPVALRDFAAFVRRFGASQRAGALGGALREFFANGGTEAVVVRIAHAARSARLSRGAVKLTAASPGAWGNQLRLRLRPGLDGTFHLQVRDGVTGQIETHQDLGFDDSPRRIDRVVNARSELVRWTAPPPKPDTALCEHAREARPGKTPWSDDGCSTRVERAARGSDGAEPSLADFVGSERESSHRGLHALERADVFDLLVIPPYRKGHSVEPALWRAAASHCARRRALLLVDPARELGDPERALRFFESLGLSSPNAALFFARDGDSPSAASVAGLLARTDAQRGPWRPIAGLGAALSGLGGLPAGDWSSHYDDRERVAARRTLLFVEESLRRGTRWAAFEPNGECLWRELRERAEAFLDELYRADALQGCCAAQAYFVRCGASTTSAAELARGRVNLVVGLAPQRPGEFATAAIAVAAGQSLG